jgi:hypothetical protein
MYYLMACRRTQLSSGWPHAGSAQWLLYDGTWERFCNIIRKLVDNFLYLKMFSLCASCMHLEEQLPQESQGEGQNLSQLACIWPSSCPKKLRAQGRISR